MPGRKLTWEMVRDIRRRYNRDTPRHAQTLADEHGISRDSVFDVLRGTDVWPLEAEVRYVVSRVHGFRITPDGKGGSGGNHTLPVEASVLDRCDSHRQVRRYESGVGARTACDAIGMAVAECARLNEDERQWENEAA